MGGAIVLATVAGGATAACELGTLKGAYAATTQGNAFFTSDQGVLTEKFIPSYQLARFIFDGNGKKIHEWRLHYPPGNR